LLLTWMPGFAWKKRKRKKKKKKKKKEKGLPLENYVALFPFHR